MSLHVLAYNLKRLMTLLGVNKVMDAIRAYALFSGLKRMLCAFTWQPLPKVLKKWRCAHNALGDFHIDPCG
ncbi:hypothetical protein [Duganella sp. Root1480D1]|uniref:hypothetical protein n=1 Tax=Duganella sp. Root1480D1 TaxID=1736471 RepID=UPI00070EC4BD|nr:hypothetical protein [Duganella sp. Root1480D1]KQZ27055.1 hypothetical protein ASD58_15905 [Duganella sp. Root1480D1]